MIRRRAPPSYRGARVQCPRHGPYGRRAHRAPETLRGSLRCRTRRLGTIHNFLDAPTLEYTFTLLSNEKASTLAARRARQTLDANLNLIDPVWGGVYQYSDEANWKSPHFEKLLAFQADDLRLYSQAYAQWQHPKYLEAALALRAYLVSFLASPEGAFYVSQDADLSAEVSGHEYYRHDEAARRRLGIPRIDTHRYARENGWAIPRCASFTM